MGNFSPAPLAREKAKLKIAKQPTNAIIKGTNLRGRDIKAEIYQRSCDEALRIADLLELGKKLSEISPTGFNPRQPNHTDWQKVLKVVAENYASELAKTRWKIRAKKAAQKRQKI